MTFNTLGLYEAAYDLGLEWAVIKGVSDFADGSKKATQDWQPFSSTLAASVVYKMFEYPDVIKDWPHYEKRHKTGKTGSKYFWVEENSTFSINFV